MMKKITFQKNPLIRKWFLIFFWLFPPVVSSSQVINGSFEINGQPSLDNWTINFCDMGESHQDAPSGGGDWCLKLESGNFQGCFPSLAYQIIPEAENGDIWQVSAWARQDNDLTRTSIYLKIFQTTGDSTVLSVDTTSSNEWTQLSIVDTLFLDESDSVAIVLDAGLIGGPLANWSYFDLVIAEKIGDIVISIDDGFSQSNPEHFKLFQNSPNPFNTTTIIRYVLPRKSKVDLRIYNLLGQEVITLVNQTQMKGYKSIRWDGKDNSNQTVGSGLYIYRLQVDDNIQNKKMLFIR